MNAETKNIKRAVPNRAQGVSEIIRIPLIFELRRTRKLLLEAVSQIGLHSVMHRSKIRKADCFLVQLNCSYRFLTAAASASPQERPALCRGGKSMHSTRYCVHIGWLLVSRHCISERRFFSRKRLLEPPEWPRSGAVRRLLNHVVISSPSQITATHFRHSGSRMCLAGVTAVILNRHCAVQISVAQKAPVIKKNTVVLQVWFRHSTMSN
ncbi:hypothetical protein CEXT_173911 [Caerostris extrusa]|uniref:Uncharacterized protein n=1 Tax=Caerostris extrusa TaxID=172846 RepID=A0AAV4QIG3_CAEEX|nr:hypothetical protein CEXT_173911 [Caerostris extrusa]